MLHFIELGGEGGSHDIYFVEIPADFVWFLIKPLFELSPKIHTRSFFLPPCLSFTGYLPRLPLPPLSLPL
jgi:hypothetical protein